MVSSDVQSQSLHVTALEAIERLKPTYAVISCAKKSRYEFPHELATNALKDIDTKIYTTADGTVIFTFKPDGTVNANQYNDGPEETPQAPDRS